jgi:competence/damage-inducible protein CinA-like protein
VTAAVIAVGSELLRAGRKDTNAEWLVARLAGLGVETVWRAAVDDDEARIARLVTTALELSDIVILTGGLGPTDDDRTRVGVARALGEPIERDEAVELELADRFLRRGRVASPAQSRQADRPRGAAWIPNPIGTAPGLLAEREGRVVIALPGVPAEMKAMFDATVAPRLAPGGTAGASIARRVLRIAGRPEAQVDEAIGDLYATPRTETTILTSAGLVDLVLSAYGGTPEGARADLEALARAMGARLGRDVYGADDDTLASVTGRLLAARGATVAVGESCTGGLLGAAITDVPGSSAWFRGSLVCYADDLKSSVALVPEPLVRAHGAVSEEVSRALAGGARRVCGASFGIGVTGIAGPTGGTQEKPVGTVHIALDDGDSVRAIRLDWPGDRDLIRRRAVAVALDLLRRRLLAP